MECEEDNAKVQKAFNNKIDGRHTGIWLSLFALFTAIFFLWVSNAVAKPLKIMVFGDSLVAGFGLPPGEAFPDILAQKLSQHGYQNEMINKGWGLVNSMASTDTILNYRKEGWVCTVIIRPRSFNRSIVEIQIGPVQMQSK